MRRKYVEVYTGASRTRMSKFEGIIALLRSTNVSMSLWRVLEPSVAYSPAIDAYTVCVFYSIQRCSRVSANLYRKLPSCKHTHIENTRSIRTVLVRQPNTRTLASCVPPSLSSTPPTLLSEHPLRLTCKKKRSISPLVAVEKIAGPSAERSNMRRGECNDPNAGPYLRM